MSTSAVVPSGCERCATPLEREDLRCTICGLGAAQRERAAAAAVVAKILRCDGCGAAVSYSAEAQGTRCAYCGCVQHLETPEDPTEQAQGFVPFDVQPERAQAALRRFLGQRSFFRPSDLASASTLASLTALWWPGWLFTARATVSWASDSEVGAGRSAWAPHAGQAPLQFRNILVNASRGLTDGEVSQLAPAYDLSKVRPTADEGPPGAIVEQFDVTRSGARKRIIEAVEAQARHEVARSQVPGTRRRNLHVAVLLSGLETRRYGLPAYVLAYRYRGALYRVVVHGQDDACVIGTAPWSMWKVLLALVLVLAALALVAAVVGAIAASA